MTPIDLFPVGTPITFKQFRLAGCVIGHRMTRVIVQTTHPLPVTMPAGTLVFDDFTLAADPALLRKAHEKI